MRETGYGHLPRESSRTLEELDDVFLHADTDALSSDTVDEIIDRAIEPIGELPDTPIIVQLSNATTLWYKSILAGSYEQSADYDDEPDQTVVAEIDAAFSGIRHQVANRLKTQLPDHEIIVLGRKKDRIYYCEDGIIGKEPIDNNPNAMGFGEPKDAKRQRMQALRTLYSLPERSERIAYNIISIDPTERAYQGVQFQRRLPITTLQDELESQNPPSLDDTIRYFMHAVEGVTFLADNGLRLTDLKLRNIAINKLSDSALLFDFDGLRPADEAIYGYPTTPAWLPPERAPKQEESYGFFDSLRDDTQNTSPIETSEMVYELGVSLTKILECYAAYPREVAILAANMTRQDPAERPELATVIQSLLDAGFQPTVR